MDERVALVLSSGGARGAYEAGALSVLLPELERRGQRPTLLVGTSAGALNAVSLAADADQPAEVAVDRLVKRWLSLRHGDVFRSLVGRQLPWTVFGYLGEILGVPGVSLPGLLDSAPLRGTLDRLLDWPAVHRNVHDGVLDSVAVVASHSAVPRSIVFIESHRDADPPAIPSVRGHDYVSATLSNDHLMASAAIPMLFPAVHIDEPAGVAGWYYDGSARLSTPLEPALELGADRIVVIGTQSIAPQRSRFWSAGDARPDFADGALQLLTAMLIIPMIEDVRRLGQVNELLSDAEETVATHRRALDKRPYRQVPYMFIAPSVRGVLGDIASEVFRRNYGGYRAVSAPDLAVLSRLLGGESEQHGELMSYLLFAGGFVGESMVAATTPAAGSTGFQDPTRPGTCRRSTRCPTRDLRSRGRHVEGCGEFVQRRCGVAGDALQVRQGVGTADEPDVEAATRRQPGDAEPLTVDHQRHGVAGVQPRGTQVLRLVRAPDVRDDHVERWSAPSGQPERQLCHVGGEQ